LGFVEMEPVDFQAAKRDVNDMGSIDEAREKIKPA
jgi:hypothetical protein